METVSLLQIQMPVKHPNGDAVEDRAINGGDQNTAPHKAVDGGGWGQRIEPAIHGIQHGDPRKEEHTGDNLGHHLDGEKKATDSNILCWAKLWPMARGV